MLSELEPYRLGKQLLQDGKLQEARVAFDKALLSGSNQCGIFEARALTFQLLGDMDAAIKDAALSIKMMSRSIEMYDIYIPYLIRTNRTRKAYSIVQLGIRLVPSSSSSSLSALLPSLFVALHPNLIDSKLPTELILRIGRFLVDTETDVGIKLASVCRRWREVFLNDRLVGQEGGPWERVPAKIDAFLERSKGRLTELLFDGLPADPVVVVSSNACLFCNETEGARGAAAGDQGPRTLISIETLNIRNVLNINLIPFELLGKACIITNLILTKVSLHHHPLCSFPDLLRNLESLTINSGCWIKFIPANRDPGLRLSLPRLKSIVLHSSVPQFGSSSNLSVASSVLERIDLVGPSDSYLPLLFPGGYQPLLLAQPSFSAYSLTHLRISLSRMKPRITETDFLDRLSHFPFLTHLLLPASNLSDTTIQALTLRRPARATELCPLLELFDAWNSRRVTGGAVRTMIRSRMRRDEADRKKADEGGVGGKLLAVRAEGCALYPFGVKWKSGWREGEKRIFESVWRDFV